jgi:hypothetical protein
MTTETGTATTDPNFRPPTPYEDGNEAALKHGARSPRRVEAIAKRVNDELLERFPIVADYPETLTALARVEGITRLMFADLASNGLFDRKGQFKASLIARYFTAENTGAKLRASLGMTPASEAEVARDRAAAASSTIDVLGELARQGRATRAQQPAPELPALAEPVTETPSREDNES